MDFINKRDENSHFYELNDRVFLGELTFTPGAMAFKYKNDDDNIKVGSLLKL